MAAMPWLLVLSASQPDNRDSVEVQLATDMYCDWSPKSKESKPQPAKVETSLRDAASLLRNSCFHGCRCGRCFAPVNSRVDQVAVHTVLVLQHSLPVSDVTSDALSETPQACMQLGARKHTHTHTRARPGHVHTPTPLPAREKIDSASTGINSEMLHHSTQRGLAFAVQQCPAGGLPAP